MRIKTISQLSTRATFRLCLVLAALAATLFGSGVAQGATVTKSGSVLRYSAAPGEVNRLLVELDNDYRPWYAGPLSPPTPAYFVDESGPGVPVIAGEGCWWDLLEHEVYCTASGVTELSLSAGDRDDSIVVRAMRRAILDGGSGNDRLAGGPADDTLDGGPGADDLSGGPGTDWVTYYGRAAAVSVTLDDVAADGEPGEGDNVRADVEDVTGTRYDDALTGSAAANRLFGAEGNDTIRGGLGADLLQGEAGEDWLSGEAGDDLLVGSYGDDRLFGGDGHDQLPGGPGGLADSDELSGGAGTDWVSYEGRVAAVRVTIDGLANDGKPSEPERPGEGDNVGTDVEDVTGTRYDDVLIGSPSANALFGLDGNDALSGGPGADRLLGHAGTDRLSGDADNDALHGLEGSDWIFGGDGNDTIPGGPAGPDDADDIFGGAGIDWVTYYGRATGVTVAIDDLADDGEPGERDNVRTDVEDVTGTSYADVLIGSAGANALFGAEGSDVITGGAGADRLVGEAGADTLHARDGIADTSVDGGADGDRAQVDAADPLVSIEGLF